MKVSVMKSKEDYIRRVAEQVRLTDEAIDALRTKSEKEGEPGKLRDRQRIVELKESRKQAVVLMNRLRESCEDCWDEVKKDADRLFRPSGKSAGKKAA